MTWTGRFDYDDYMRGFREACAQRGIDPARGANGYEVVHVIAEQRKAAWRSGAADGWWQRHDLWLSCPPYCSVTEQEAIWNVFMQAYALTAALIARALCRRYGRGVLTPPRLQGGESPKALSPLPACLREGQG